MGGGDETGGSSVVDVGAFAVQNCYETNYEMPKGETIVLINAGASVVNINVVKDGSTVFTVSPDQMTVAVKNARMDTTIDIKEMVGKRTRMTVSALGETLKKEIIDTVQYSQLTASMGRQDLIRLHTMPTKPVKIGEKWTATKPDTNDAMGGRMVTLSTGDFTLLSRENRLGVDCLKISYTGKMTVKGKGTMNGMDFFVEGSGTTSGTYFQAVKTGLTVWEDSKYDVESTVALTGAQNLTIPSSTSVSSHRILLKD